MIPSFHDSWAPRLLAAVSCWVLLLASAAPGQSEPPDWEALEERISRVVNEKQLVGLSVGVLHDGEVVLAKGLGARSLETGEPVAEDTLFAVGSVTKQFTCAAVLLLEEEGKLALADPVSKYLPALPRAADVTLLDLCQHVSGYRDYYPLDFVDRAQARPRPSLEVIREFASLPLDFEPGTRWSYSNTGYLILGYAAERSSGQDFGTFLRERIFTPLGLAHTRYEVRPGEEGAALGYTSFALGEPTLVAPEGEGWIGAAGGLWSTPRDLLAWDLALMDGKLLSPSSWERMITPRRLADGRFTDSGCGRGLREEGSTLVLSHTGAVSGFNALNTLVPATRSALVLLTNLEGSSAVLQSLQELVLPPLLPLSRAVPEIAGPPALEAALAMLEQLRSGRVERDRLGEEYGAFLTEERVRAAAASLGPLGEPQSAAILRTSERGGMEVTRIRLEFESESALAWMYRTPDGRIQEFLVFRP